jgi:hypothetical protein
MTHRKKAVSGVERARLAGCLLLALGLGACATSPPPNASGPRPNEPPYPVLLTETTERRQAVLIAWTKFTVEQGITNAPAPELQPVTATIRSLPTLTGPLLHLPKVGDIVPMNEENTRESLRRFITSASPLLGAQPQQLSLVQRIDAADGTKRASYEQRPFRFPLRGGYGKLEIAFSPDGRVLQINSTCIPEIEQLQRAGAGIRPKWDAEKVATQVQGRTFNYRDLAGDRQTVTLRQDEAVIVRELVIHPLVRSSDPSRLEFHLAWEITVKRASDSFSIYLDAVTDDVIAVSPISERI